MSVPFFRGGDSFDWWFLSLLAACQIQDNASLAEYLIGGFEEPITYVWADAAGLLPGYVVAIGPTTVLIGIEGTVGVPPFAPQWLANVLGSFQSNVPPFPGAVHTYFGSAAAALGSAILPVVSPYFTEKRFVFTGHSLGGACAQLLYSVMGPLCLAGVSCMVLGSPRVGDPFFANAVPGVQRLTNSGDPVPGLPPTLWAASPDTFPVPGPPPFSIYTTAGTGQTLEADGSVNNNDTAPSVDEVLQSLISGAYIIHFCQFYAGRLALQLADTVPRMGDPSGYADPQRLVQVWGQFAPSPGSPTEEGPAMYKVTTFFTLKSRGYTYSYYSPQTNASQRRNDLSAWLSGILSLSCPQVTALYTRYSNLSVKRQVDWDTPASLGISPNGAYNANVAQEDDALFIRGSLVGGGKMEQFFHGYPELLVVNETLNLAGQPWFTKFLQFANFLIAAGSAYQFKNINQGARPAPVLITSATPGAYRGYKIVPAVADVRTVGDVVYVNQVTRSAGDGYQGRKIVTSADPAGAFFTVGGAIPFGSIGTSAQYSVLPPVFAALNDYRIERYSEHRLGRPFGERPGRVPNRLPLRR